MDTACCRVSVEWTRGGKPSDEEAADDWHLAFRLRAGEGDAAALVTFKQYCVYLMTEPAEWDEFLSDGAPESAEVCGGALRRERARGRVVFRHATEGTDTDAVMEVSVPEAWAVAGLRREIRYLATAGRYYPSERWVEVAHDDDPYPGRV